MPVTSPFHDDTPAMKILKSSGEMTPRSAAAPLFRLQLAPHRAIGTFSIVKAVAEKAKLGEEVATDKPAAGNAETARAAAGNAETARPAADNPETATLASAPTPPLNPPAPRGGGGGRSRRPCAKTDSAVTTNAGKRPSEDSLFDELDLLDAVLGEWFDESFSTPANTVKCKCVKGCKQGYCHCRKLGKKCGRQCGCDIFSCHNLP